MEGKAGMLMKMMLNMKEDGTRRKKDCALEIGILGLS